MAASLHTAAHRELVSVVIALRKRAGLTQRQLAAAVGREQNFVARIETGQRRLDLVELITLFRACGVDPEREIGALTRRVAALIKPGGLAKAERSVRPRRS